ncbi:hypothetical protein E4T56_gene3532 [Termitomyces sp. T112]|nr:hypothetical protein E4T56_gene3532 [Termitomyces sp. T112]
MSPSTEVLFQQLYDTENSVLVSALRGDLPDLQGRVKQLTVPTTLVAGLSTIQLVEMPVASGKGRGKEMMDLPVASGKGKDTSSLPPALASTLAPIAKAEEPNNDEAAQPKEDENEMDCATTVAIAVNQSAIADDSALISDPIAIVTNSGIPSRSITKSVGCTGPTTSITDLAITTNSITSTRPAAIITNSVIATRLAASNESTVPTGVETILAKPIAATGHLMDVEMTGPAPPHPPDEIVP